MLRKLEELDIYAQCLKTQCSFRNAEIDNLRTIISLESQCLNLGIPTDGNIEKVEQRLKELQERPDYAGQHERFKSYR